MAAPVVQQCVKFAVGSGSSGTVNNMLTLTAGRLAVVGYSVWTSTATNFTCSDSVNGSYTRQVVADAAAETAAIFYKANLSGGLVNVSWASGSGNGVTMMIHEVSGADTTSPLVGTNTNTNTGTTHDSLEVDNTGNTDAIYLAMLSLSGSGTVSITLNQTGTEGTWAEFNASARETDGNSFMAGSMVNLGVTSALSRGHVWGSASAGAAQVVAVFKAAAGAATTAPLPWSPMTALQPLFGR